MDNPKRENETANSILTIMPSHNQAQKIPVINSIGAL